MKTKSPSEIAQRFGVDHAKVLRWIDSGQLKAVNVATNPTGRPRWRVSDHSLAEFEQARANVPPLQPTRRRSAAPVTRRYY